MRSLPILLGLALPSLSVCSKDGYLADQTHAAELLRRSASLSSTSTLTAVATLTTIYPSAAPTTATASLIGANDYTFPTTSDPTYISDYVVADTEDLPSSAADALDTWTTLSDTTSSVQLIANSDGNLYLGNYKNSTPAQPGSNFLTSENIVMMDEQSRFFHYYPGEMRVYNVSRLRVSDIAASTPLGSQMISLVPFNTGSQAVGGLEVYSLAYGATDIDRRGVQTQTLERLAFSADSHLLLVPIFPEAVNGIPTAEELRQAWTGDILRAQEDYYTSHASYIKDHSTGGPDRVFAWNEKEGSFGIMDVEVMRARTAGIGTVPAVSGSGDVAAVVVHRTLIQLYSLLQHQEEDPTGNVRTRGASYSVEEAVARPVTEVAWTQEWATQQHSCRRRLIVCSAGGKQVPSESTEYASETPEAGRIIVLDFDEALPGGKNLEVTIDLDDDNVPLLEEQELDLQTEISIVRRRTQRQQKSDAIKRSLTSPRPSNRDGSYGAGPYLNRAAPQSTGNLPEMAESFEQPYSQGQPRSQLSLQRAATSIVRRHPVALPPPRAANRDDLTAEPLPLYSAEPNAPLPGHLRPLAGLRPLPIRQTYGPGTNQEPYLAPNYATPEPPEPSPNRHSSIRRPLPPAASPGLRRGPSRASRSAAANVAPLRKKGWLGRRKERKARKQAADERGTGGSKEDRKCAVM
ncbi:hypothetical protein B0A49_00416 [Cryomyces minteri]|uniref:DUF7165 domain-containing protein n=1 Tax=Cryomyces minteri TaxID=331657 RepID=A0A4U0XZP4_9PEZI|nr:hypothetical protein B0A49_00416 [Cryomyces minteri]